MVCTKCHIHNMDSSKFCSNCGEKLLEKCSICAFSHPLDSAYCTETGKRFVTAETNKKIRSEQEEHFLELYRTRIKLNTTIAGFVSFFLSLTTLSIIGYYYHSAAGLETDLFFIIFWSTIASIVLTCIVCMYTDMFLDLIYHRRFNRRHP